MGGRTGRFVGGKARESYNQKRSVYNQQLASYNSRVKFGKTSTREGGLSSAEIGSPPSMKFGRGFMGDYERILHGQSQGLSQSENRRLGGLGFGAKSPLLG